jgi:DNA-binding CsgD family transcriptional regulator
VIPDVPLSKREKEVLKFVLQGKSNKQIAWSLAISIRTVEFHLKNVYAKFQVSSRIELLLKLGQATHLPRT